MKSALGASTLFYILVGVSFVIFFLAMPYPHYNPVTKNWFLGTSAGNRILGERDATGVPLDELAITVSRASLTSPLDIQCSVDEDCEEYTIINECAIYCGNQSQQNDKAVVQLNNNRVCDPALWHRPSVNCQCIAGRCLTLN